MSKKYNVELLVPVKMVCAGYVCVSANNEEEAKKKAMRRLKDEKNPYIAMELVNSVNEGCFYDDGIIPENIDYDFDSCESGDEIEEVEDDE